MNDNMIVIGKIIAPQGVRGEVRVMPLTDFPERFRELKSAELDDGTNLPIESVRYHQQFVLLKFRDMNDRNAIEHLRGKLIQIEHKDLVPLPTGHYYIFDIVGLEVFTEENEYLGKVTDVLETGSNDVYIVEQKDKKPLLIPALKTVVLKIDIPDGKMIVKLQEVWESDAD
ncbi:MULTISPECIES: ribosome maturation factor RimM [Pelosinus]|uniref:Ribosome maturation factor RimM n=1 Tax=Pelosinus fermentans B4 TaxID=1149862 RepID=I9LCH2_9FIRM|nr:MULTISPECIES: ribosome maturation factor RimM [Pelosinus]EIW18046.1 16S rRNA processing protein RimM [Pelosinus fermentans B4]EIW24084.1 Ribosome maturation factor rimM [Pelosinus fermentans A11]OAM94221.1 Ribosome maturation factor rimM [Pelosinus fermentans DSM 17108]SDR03325.1 16S rRNA processing protein RimM [Pelosinus fermentans]